MKRFLLSFGLIAIFVLYAFEQALNSSRLPSSSQISYAQSNQGQDPLQTNPTQSSSGDPVLPIASNSSNKTTNSATSNKNRPVQNPPKKTTPGPSEPAAVKGKFRDGTYTGSSVDVYYGNVQVQAVVSGGKLVDVVFLDHPQDRRTSVFINSQAMPLLKQEALQAQSANVNTISGATDTSGGFRESLNNALAQAS